MKQLAVLIPCYNEALTIKKVVTECIEAVKGYDAEVIVYDNNSTDKTDEIARNAGATVRYEYMQGKGNVIRRMFREIDAECYIMIDGDDTYPAAAIPKMAEIVFNKKADMVVGDRLSSTYFTENKRRFHNAGNKVVRSFVNNIFKSDILDIMTGFRAFSYNFVKTFPVISSGFEIETEMTIHALDKRMFVENYIISYQDRPDGSESKLNTLSDGLNVIKTIFRLFRSYKPLSFFSIIGAILFVIAIGVFIPIVLIPYINTGLVETFPTLIVCGITLLISLLSFSTGLILDNSVQQERREFEFRLQIIESKRKNLL